MQTGDSRQRRALVLAAGGLVHGGGSHEKDDKLPNEHAAVDLLVMLLMYPAAQFTVHDSESSTLFTLLPQMPSACALVI